MIEFLAFLEVPRNSAPVAQLDRASGYEPEGREFESLRAHHLLNDLRGFSFEVPLGVAGIVAPARALTCLFVEQNYCVLWDNMGCVASISASGFVCI
jgi:hypothetical protein